MVVGQRTNQRDSIRSPKRRAVEVRKQPVAQLRIAPEDAERRLTIGPNLARRSMSVGPCVREEQSHLRPANVEFGTGWVRQCGSPKKATDVEAGKRGTRHDPAERATQAGRHVRKGAGGITAPMHRGPLRARIAGTSPDQAVTMDLFRRIKDGALVKQGIQVVQLLG